MSAKQKPEDIVAIECRHATYCPPPYGQDIDLHVIKQIVHFADGTTKPRVSFKENFEQPFWVTKKGRRNHKEKKEHESLDNVQKYSSTVHRLPARVAEALGKYASKPRLKQLAISPYLYGTDITSSAVIKRMHMTKYPGVATPMTMAATDVETDMSGGPEDIVMQTLSFKDRVFTAVVKKFVAGYSNPEAQLQKLMLHYLGDDVRERNIKWEVVFVETAADVVMEVMKRAHEWQPDFLAIWNIEFDMNKMIDALEQANIDPADVMSDPAVPRSYRHFNFKLGPAKKVTAEGKETPLTPSQRWHSVSTPASFIFIDAMCAYRQIRTGSQEEPSYSLDAIMNKEIERTKLKFTEADGYTDKAWHIFMQANYPLEYIIYNVFDCIGMEILDEKTTDLSISLAMFSGTSDYARFNSQPTRLCNDYHWYLLENGHVLGSTSSEMKDENDELTVNGRGWITMLSAHQVLDNGLKCIGEYANVPSNARGFVGDLDVEGSYPNGGMAFNISKATTKREIIGIKGVSEEQRRRQGINLSGGYVNSVEFCVEIFNLPTLDQVYSSYLRHKASSQ